MSSFSDNILVMNLRQTELTGYRSSHITVNYLYQYATEEVRDECKKRRNAFAGAERIELPSKVLETSILPLNYAPCMKCTLCTYVSSKKKRRV